MSSILKKMRLSSILSLTSLILFVSSHFETILGGWMVNIVGGGGNKASSVKLKPGAGTELGNVLSISRIASYYWC